MKRTIAAALLAIFLVCAACAAAWVSLRSTTGSLKIVRWYIQNEHRPKVFRYESASGSLLSGLHLTDVVVEEPSLLAGGSLEAASVDIGPLDLGNKNFLKIYTEDLEIKTDLPALQGSSVTIQSTVTSVHSDKETHHSIVNGVLRPGASDPILFFGLISKRALELHLYAKSAFSPHLDLLLSSMIRHMKAQLAISDANIDAFGSFTDTVMSGKLTLDSLKRGGFIIEGSRVSSEGLRLVREKAATNLTGDVLIQGGALRYRNTLIQLDGGKIAFDGDPENPALDITARSRIGDTDIRIRLRGTMDRPDIHLSSSPPQTEEMLLLMLATGKKWQGLEPSLREGRVSFELAKDFFDYFILGGTGEKMAERFGIKSIMIGYEENTKSFFVKKEITKKIDVGLGLEKTEGKDEATSVAKKVGLDYQVSKDTSVAVEGRVESPGAPGPSTETTSAPAGDQSVSVKLKRAF